MTWKLSEKLVMGKIIKPGLRHPPNYDHAPVLAFVTNSQSGEKNIMGE